MSVAWGHRVRAFDSRPEKLAAVKAALAVFAQRRRRAKYQRLVEFFTAGVKALKAF